MNLKFNLQFFGSSGSTRQYRKRDPEPDELVNLRNGLYESIMPGLQAFDSSAWQKAQETTNNALQQQNQLVSQLSGSLGQNNDLLNEMMNVVRTGNVPTGITDKLNAGLNGLSNRGVLNSSITSQGVSRLGQQAADAYNKNYLNAFNSVLSGYGQGLQSAQGNTNALLSGINAVGQIPSQAYEGAYAGLMPAFNMWKAWQNSYDNREDYDTVVKQGSSGCITGDTIVTLENEENIPVSELKNGDLIKAWNFDDGCLSNEALTAFFKQIYDKDIDVIRLHFKDGSNVGVIYEHLFFDMTSGKFIAINNKDNDEFIGHNFAKVNNSGKITPVKLVAISHEKTRESYAPQTGEYLSFLVNGFISGNDGQLGLCNRFDFDTERMIYKDKSNDLLNYGRLGYNALKDIVSKEFFQKHRCDEFSVAIGKGLMTLEQLRGYLKKFSHCFLI